MKPKDVKDNNLTENIEEFNKKNRKFKLDDYVRMLKYKNIFSKGYTQNWSEEILIINKAKNTVPWTYLINELKGEEIKGRFYEKELIKTNQKEFRIEKIIKKKENKLYVKWKGYDNGFNSWIVKKNYYKMGDYLTDYKPGHSNVKVELDLKNYASKEELKHITPVDTSIFALKRILASLKTEVDEIGIPKFITVPKDLADLTLEVQKDFTKKTDFNSLNTKVDKNETENYNLESNKNDTSIKTIVNNLRTKVDDIDISKYVLKTDYDTKIGNLELKIPDIKGLLQISYFNSKVIELEHKIKTAENKPDICNLATKSGLTTVENKIPNVNGFVKLSDYTPEITKIKNDYVTNTALTGRINDLKNQHVADEVKKADDNVKIIVLIH